MGWRHPAAEAFMRGSVPRETTSRERGRSGALGAVVAL